MSVTQTPLSDQVTSCLAIVLNTNPHPEPCPLCGGATNPNIGPEIATLEGMPVCQACGEFHAPALSALLTLADFARAFVQTEQDFGNLRLAAQLAPYSNFARFVRLDKKRGG